jgi:hypothetical protein
MSDPNPAGGPATAPKPTGAPDPKAPPAPKTTNYKVASKHDWCVCKAASEGEARQKWHEFFGIKGSDHEVEVKMTSEKAGTHSGQRTASTFILTGEKGSLAEPAKAQ